ncbi:MAG: hypothetical protein HY883_06400 [Deltaproteobacteria bacterium]|nr:hypothetical protein [Deltaproteobacteria bacterium]
MFFTDGKVSRDFLLNGSFNYAHPDYPLLVPLSVAWLYTCLGRVNDQLAKVIYPLQYLSLLMVFHYMAEKASSRRNASLFTALLALTPIVTIHAGGLPSRDFVGYADLTLSIYFAGAGGFFYLYIVAEDRFFLIISALFLGMGAWTKNEGLVFALIGGGLAGAYLLRKKRTPEILTAACILVILAAPWLVYKVYLNITSEYAGNMKIAAVRSNINRLPFILAGMKYNMFGNIALYNFTWYGYALTSLMNWRGFFRNRLIFLHAMLFLQFGAYIFVYIISPSDINWQISTSLDRLILHMVPFALLIAAINTGILSAGCCEKT